MFYHRFLDLVTLKTSVKKTNLKGEKKILVWDTIILHFRIPSIFRSSKTAVQKEWNWKEGGQKTLEAIGARTPKSGRLEERPPLTSLRQRLTTSRFYIFRFNKKRQRFFGWWKKTMNKFVFFSRKKFRLQTWKKFRLPNKRRKKSVFTNTFKKRYTKIEGFLTTKTNQRKGSFQLPTTPQKISSLEAEKKFGCFKESSKVKLPKCLRGFEKSAIGKIINCENWVTVLLSLRRATFFEFRKNLKSRLDFWMPSQYDPKNMQIRSIFMLVNKKRE